MIKVTENILERTARVLTDSHDLKVVFDNTNVGINRNVITLPTLPANASDKFINSMQGYLDHQASKAIFSEPTKLAVAKTTNKTPGFKDVLELVEGQRVEKCMTKFYPGSALNLENAYADIFGKISKDFDKLPFFNQVLAASMARIKYPDCNFYSGLSQELKDWAESVNDVYEKYSPTTLTASIKAANAIMQLLDQPQPPPPCAGGSSEDKTDQKSDQKSDSDNESDQQNDQNKAESKSDDKSDQKSGSASSSSDSEDDSKSKGSSQANPSPASTASSNVNTPMSVEDLGKELTEVSKAEATQDKGKQQKSASDGYTHDIPNSQKYSIASTKDDKVNQVEPRDYASAMKNIASLRDEAAPLTHTIKFRLVNSLRAKSARKWQGGKPEGKLDTRRMYQSITSNAENIYKKRTEKVHMDTVVALAIDHSGSMSDERIELASKAAIVLGDVLSVLGVPFMVYGFSTKDTGISSGNSTIYSRYTSLQLDVYSGFDKSWKQGSLALVEAPENIRENTLDAESVLWGCKQLMNRKEKRKILFVFNDGEPYPGRGRLADCQQHLKNVVSAAKNHVDIITFGIQTDNVKHYYPDHCVINNLDDLVKEPLQRIDSILRKGMK